MQTSGLTKNASAPQASADIIAALRGAGVQSSGIVPPGIEGSGQSLAELLGRIVRPGFGIEIISNVNNIPKVCWVWSGNWGG